MTIIKRKVRRQISEDEFLRLNSEQPFEGYRQDAKRVNFGFLFGMSYRKFTSQSLETSWTLEKVEAFIEEKDLQDELDKMIDRHGKEESLRMCKYFTVANYIRTQFFDAYKGLEKRIKRNVEFAKTHGYIRSYHGAFRRLPLFALAFDEDGKRRPDELGLELSNWSNITANTSIQTDEVCTVMQGIHEWDLERQEQVSLASNRIFPGDGIDGWVIGTVHDSVDFYVAKTQILEALKKMKRIFEKNDPWQKGLVFPVDIMIVDLEDPEQYYKNGVKLKKFMEKVA